MTLKQAVHTIVGQNGSKRVARFSQSTALLQSMGLEQLAVRRA